MAFIDKSAFEARITNNRNDDLVNIAGKFFDSDSAAADCSAGLLCKRGDNLDCDGFTGVKNENAYKMSVASGTDSEFYACNPYDVKQVGGYYIGKETLGIGIPSGKYGVFTRINMDGQSVYRFGEGLLTATLGDKKFLSIANGKLTPATTAPTDASYFKVLGTGKFIEGVHESFGYVDVCGVK